MAVMGAGLAAAALAQAPMYVLMVPLFGFLATLGVIFPNAGAGALEHQKHRAGAASALAGMLQFGLSALAAGSVSLLHAQSPLPMAGMMALCGLMSCAIFLRLRAPRPAAAAEQPPESSA